MATIIKQIVETTNTGSTGLGFSLPMSGNAVFNPTYTTRDVVRANLINWLLTNKGERVFRPNFGANLRELIFEGITEGSNSILEERITNTIAEEFPMVTVVKTQFIRLEDQYTINFILEYKIMNMDTVDELNIQLNG
jgi:phage baseplate assembly protein W